MQDLFAEGRANAPLGLLMVVIESSNASAIRPDVQLQVKFKRVLIPSRIGCASGGAEDRTSLTELLKNIQGRRMLKSGQGTEKLESAWRTGGVDPGVVNYWKKNGSPAIGRRAVESDII